MCHEMHLYSGVRERLTSYETSLFALAFILKAKLMRKFIATAGLGLAYHCPLLNNFHAAVLLSGWSEEKASNQVTD